MEKTRLNMRVSKSVRYAVDRLELELGNISHDELMMKLLTNYVEINIHEIPQDLQDVIGSFSLKK